MFDPFGVQLRSRRSLHRRAYQVESPTSLWHMYLLCLYVRMYLYMSMCVHTTIQYTSVNAVRIQMLQDTNSVTSCETPIEHLHANNVHNYVHVWHKTVQQTPVKTHVDAYRCLRTPTQFVTTRKTPIEHLHVKNVHLHVHVCAYNCTVHNCKYTCRCIQDTNSVRH